MTDSPAHAPEVTPTALVPVTVPASVTNVSQSVDHKFSKTSQTDGTFNCWIQRSKDQQLTLRRYCGSFEEYEEHLSRYAE
jgi:hypothetical protein